MFDRFAITNLSPFIMKDLDMSNAQLGQLMSVFAIAWAISGFFVSIVSDVTKNKKRLLMFIVILFSAFSFLTGLAKNFAMLIGIRFVMGLFEGPILPIAEAFSLAQSSERRRGLNMGLISTTSTGLIGNLLGPILLVALCEIFQWRITFFLTIIPGLIVAALIYKVLQEPDMTAVTGAAARDVKPSFKDSLIIFKNRNVRTSMAFGIFIMIWNVGTLTFAPVYLVSAKGFSPTEMSYIMAAAGLGAVVWGMLVPSLSDRFGRRPIVIIFSLLSVISPLGLMGANSGVVIAVILFIGWSGSGVFALHQGAIIGESVDTKYASTAMASAQMTGELGGCVVGVAIAGIIADAYGLHTTMAYTACCAAVAGFIAFAYYETAPLVLAKRKGAEQKTIISP